MRDTTAQVRAALVQLQESAQLEAWREAEQELAPLPAQEQIQAELVESVRKEYFPRRSWVKCNKKVEPRLRRAPECS